jgi:archaellum biogenesis ATPase FlaH
MERSTEWILDAALDYAAAGYSVIPVRSDKTPYTPHGLKDASQDPDTIRKWWETWPDANVAIACGRVSGNLVVLDVDMKNGKNGKRSIEIWEAEHGDLPETVMANTPSGGKHYFFRVKDPSLYKNTVEALVGVDIRGDGAYVLVYPSGVGGDGKMYTWAHGVSITDQEEIADANASVLELLELNSRDSKPQDAAKRQRAVVNVEAGGRNDTIFRYAASQCGLAVPLEVALDAALKLNETFNPPLDPAEVEKTVRSAYSYEPNEKTIYGDNRPEVDENGEYIPRLPAELSREFLLNPPPKNKPVVMNYLREEEAMLLSGPPKAGKSFLIVQLALSIATGSKWLGVTCQKKTVLYIDAELSSAMTGERIRDIRERMGISYLPDNLHVINTKTGQKDQITLRDVADDFVHGIRKEEVVIIDPLYMFLKDSDENDNSKMKKEMEQIRRIAAIGVTVIVVHHMAKGTQAGKMSIDRASGAGVLGRFFDSILTLNLLNREATDKARPERVEADTRSFQQPMPVNLWFDGFHTVDSSGDLADRDLNDPKKTMTEQKSANDAGRLNHCYHWMKDNCMLQPDGSFTVEDIIDAYETNYNKRMARTTMTGQLDRAGFVKYKGIVEETVGDKVTRRKKNLYVPDGLEDI